MTHKTKNGLYKSKKKSKYVKKSNTIKKRKLVVKNCTQLGRYSLHGGGAQSAVILLWINDIIRDTIYKGEDVDRFLADFKIDNWNSFRQTYQDQQDTTIFFFYDSAMVSAKSNEISEYISKISTHGIICIDIRKGVLKWIYDNYILRVLNTRYRKNTDSDINTFISDYLRPKSEPVDDNKSFDIDSDINISVPDAIYETVQNIDLFEFINTILFSAHTPIYFRVDILRVMAQLYVSAFPQYTKILAIDMDIAPKSSEDPIGKTHNEIINILLNPYTPLLAKAHESVKELYFKIHKVITDESRNEKIVMIMVNNENSLTLLSLPYSVDRTLYIDCMTSILIISPILVYLSFLRYPSNYNISKSGIQRKDNVKTYEKLKCHAFSQIVYSLYPYLRMLYKLMMAVSNGNYYPDSDNDEQWGDKTNKYFRYNSNDITTPTFTEIYIPLKDILRYTGVVSVKVDTSVLDMPTSQFHDDSPCNKLTDDI